MKSELLSKCKWPKLPEKYSLALRSAVYFILENYSVLGIVVSGTIIRGNPDPSSDLDIYVIHNESFRQRLQKFFNNVPAEIFINPPKAVKGYFEKEQEARKPLTAHMLATGFVILEVDQVVKELQAEAGKLLLEPPEPPKDLTYQRYLSALLFEDAIDVIEKDSDTAEMIVNRAVAEMLNFCFIEAGSFIPRQKSLLNELAKIDENIAELARSFYQTTSLKKKIEIAGKIADRTIGERGFFEWESPPDSISE